MALGSVIAPFRQAPMPPILRYGPMGTPVRTDPSIYTGIGHPSWLNPVYGGAATPTYHTYTPQRGGWALPSGTHLGFTQGKGYYAIPGAPRAPAAPPVDPWTKLVTQLMGSYETPAQQEARVNREIDTQIAAQKKLYDDEYARQMEQARANAAGMAAAGAAAAAMNKDLIGMVGGEYNAAAGEIKGLSHGLTGVAGGATKGDIASANTALDAMAGGSGNIHVQAGAGGGPLAPGGDVQAGVEDYRDGTLGSQLFGSLGEASTFGLAGQIGAQNMKATEEAKAALMQATKDANDAHTKAIDALAAGRLDLFHTYMNDAQDAQIKRITLAQGIQSAISASSTGAKPITRTNALGQVLQYNPVTGKWDIVDKNKRPNTAAANAAARAKLPNSALSKIYGHIVDGNGNAILDANGKLQPVAKDPKTAKVDLQLSRALHRWVDSNGHPIPGMNAAGQPKPPPLYKPGTKKTAEKDAPTREDMQQATEDIRQYGLQLRAQQKLKAYNAKTLAKNPKFVPITADELSHAPTNVLAAIGLTDAEVKAIQDPHTLQEVYIDLAAAIGGRRAWALIRKTFPNFGQGYYK